MRNEGQGTGRAPLSSFRSSSLTWSLPGKGGSDGRAGDSGLSVSPNPTLSIATAMISSEERMGTASSKAAVEPEKPCIKTTHFVGEVGGDVVGEGDDTRT